MGPSVDDIKPAFPGPLNYGNYGISLIMGHAEFLSSTVTAVAPPGPVHSQGYGSKSERIHILARIFHVSNSTLRSHPPAQTATIEA